MSDQHGRPTARETQAQYARFAQRYARSSLHRRGESLEAVRRLAAATADDIVLDLGTGTGFTAFAVAPEAARVVAADLTPEMLREARAGAAQLHLEEKLDLVLTVAEGLPFASGSISVVTCRYASHHFHDLPLALTEIHRVLRPGGRFVLCDVVAPEGPGLVELMNRLEMLRDTTHVWDYPVSEWRQELLPEAGFAVRQVAAGKNPQMFSEWVHRSGTPPEVVQTLLDMFGEMGAAGRQAFEVRWHGADIAFSWDNVTVLATKG